METLVVVVGWIVAVFLGLLGLIILWYIWQGKIDLTYVISERDGSASLSRFQFLIFTFVIAISFLIVVVGQDPPALPELPSGVFVLLGISGGSYLISKGIQTSKEINLGPEAAGKGGGGESANEDTSSSRPSPDG